jgi:predicted nucleic acid-binding Zn finger protein
MEFELAYQQQTQVLTTINSSALDFATNMRRAPVSFQGRVQEPLLMRQMMLAMHRVIVSDYNFDWRLLLDPIITVHPDQIFFEAFSNDQSTYARFSMKPEAFSMVNEPQYGTTNIDFTRVLRSAIQQMRTHRDTRFGIGPQGFKVQTETGMGSRETFERKVDVPDSWVRGFLQVQSALAAKPFTFDVRPVDLMSVINHFLDARKTRPPTALRYEFKKDAAISIVVEPWEQRYWLQDTAYTGYDRVVRVWGRKRLELLTGVLPYADKVTIGLLGRGLPHFYICHCGNYQFTLVLSGWTENDWATSTAMDMLAPMADLSKEQMAMVYNYLATHLLAKPRDVEAHTMLSGPQVEMALFSLCREGRVMYDPAARAYRNRELFPASPDFEKLIAPNPRLAQAQALVNQGAVQITAVGPSETRRNETRVEGKVGEYDVLVAMDPEQRLRFAQCTCKFFRENMLSLGPCEHIMALRAAAEPELQKTQLAPKAV